MWSLFCYRDTLKRPKIFYNICYIENKDYYGQAKRVLDKANEAGRPIGCFISEIIVASDGIIAPPAGFYKDIYK